MENYNNVSQDIRDQLNAEAKAIQIILTGIDNDIYSTVDACLNAREMWKAIERLKQGESINVQDLETNSYIGRLKKLTSRDGTPVVQKSGIQCYNCKEYRHVSRECMKLKRVKDAAYHKEKMLLCKQEEAEVQLMLTSLIWKDDTDDESDDQELEAHYMYMAQIQEVTPDLVDNSGPIFDDEPMHKVQNNNDNYNVFAMENEHPEQLESSNDIYLAEQGDTNITIDSLDICYDRVQDDQDDTDDLDQERDLLASLIQKLKYFKTKNKSLESSNNHFKEANNELSKTNQLMFKDLKKFQAELDKYNDVNYASKVEIDCAKAKGDLMSYKIDLKRTVKFGNDQIAPILGYGDMVQGTITIKRVYYIEGLNYNLFSIGQFCDADLEVAFWKSTCYIRDLKGNDLLTGSRGINLYSITLQDSTTPNLICLMAKATSSQAWLWHHRLSHLNFDTINLLSKNNIVNGIPKLKFVKDHLCSSCELGKAKKKVFSH
ncbi:retrovirus-related pol polyprotein from transposon TNT 1-94 [Tanacetum coccineum]